MEAKTDKELQKIGEEQIEAQNAFNEGYFEAIPKRKKLNRYERENIERLQRLRKFGDPQQQQISDIELRAYLAQKLHEGLCPDTLRNALKEVI